MSDAPAPPKTPGSNPRPAPLSAAMISNPGLLISGPGRPLSFRHKVARGIGRISSALIRLSRLGFSEAKSRGNKALTTFSQQPEFTRQRVYAFGSYSVVVALTLAAQLWEPNSLQAYVKVEPIALPEATVIFVRNDSNRDWKDVKVTLNGRYVYFRPDLPPSRYISLPVDRFGIFDPNGKASYAAKETVPRLITVDCNQGHFELDLESPR